MYLHCTTVSFIGDLSKLLELTRSLDYIARYIHVPMCSRHTFFTIPNQRLSRTQNPYNPTAIKVYTPSNNTEANISLPTVLYVYEHGDNPCNFGIPLFHVMLCPAAVQPNCNNQTYPGTSTHAIAPLCPGVNNELIVVGLNKKHWS